MIDTVRETVTRYSMLSEGDCIAVGLSGGADSVSLLSALLELSDDLKLTVRAVHINHGIRGENALRDEQFCSRLCARLGVELECIRLDVPTIAAQRGIGLEQCGRECRYEQFAAIAAKYGCKIATAHTLSDSAETVLFNLTRGSGLAGVCGIPPVRGNIIRPLIGVTRRQVEEYCRSRGLEYVTDETNIDTAYSRNLIRSSVIPALERVNPSMHRAFERFGACAREDNELLDALCAEALERAVCGSGWDAAAVADMPLPLRRRAVMQIAALQNTVPEYAQVELCLECIGRGSGAVVLKEGVRFSVERGLITLGNIPAVQPREEWSVPLTLPSTPLPDGRRLVLTQIELNDYLTAQKNHNSLFKNTLSYDIITFNVSVRNRRGGDRYAQAGRGVNRLLKKFLCDEGVPADRRDSLAVIADGRNILWVEGFGISDASRPKPGDRTAFLAEIL